MAKIKLKKAVIEAATATLVDGKPKLTFLWDSEQPGFGLQVTPAGTKSYVVQYRLNGVSRRMSLGMASEAFPVEKARRRALEALSQVKADGIDVMQERTNRRAEQRATQTLGELMRPYIEQGAGKRQKLKARTAVEYGKLFKNHIEPGLGGMKLTDVDRDAVAAWHSKIGKETERTANFALAVLRAFYGCLLYTSPSPRDS